MGIPFLDIFNIGAKILDKVIPDPAAKAAAQLELAKLNQAGEFKEMEDALARDLAQVEINKIEAASDDRFKSGWRPFAGWTCGAGLAYSFLIQPISTFVSSLF